ncbi:MAG: hypothetical protein J6J11_08195 [Treponema sp.]|nr:hypothetical protein [Treponema sp.]
MSASNNIKKIDKYLLKGKLRRNGFEKIRYLFNGINKISGEQKTFFIEIYYVNPLISPSEPTIAQKSKLKLSSADDLQYALAGTDSALTVSQEVFVLPSYALLKAGYFGEGGKQFNKFYSASSLVWSKNDDAIKLDNCIFSHDSIVGSICVEENDLLEHAEYLCSAGKMDWNLHFEKNIMSNPLCNNKTNFWIPIGAKTVYAGIVHVDGQEYTVMPRNPAGYIDKSWGSKLPNPFFHLSSATLTSSITGHLLNKSCFAVEGEFDGRLSIFVSLEGKNYELSGNNLFDNYSEIHDWSSMPKDDDDEKLHWSVSIHKGNIVIDIDIFSVVKDMFIRDYEVPAGGKSLLKILAGSNGYGEIRIYKKTGKSIVLQEHATVSNALCEYGTIDDGEE